MNYSSYNNGNQFDPYGFIPPNLQPTRDMRGGIMPGIARVSTWSANFIRQFWKGQP